MSAAPPTRTRRAAPMDARIRARRRAVAHERVRRRRRAAASVLGLLLLVVAGGAVAMSPLFAIDDIQVVGVAGERADEVGDTVGLQPGDNLLTADLRTATARVESLAWVRRAELHRAPPTTVEVHVTPRVPVLAVRIPEAVWLVDAEGVVVAGGDREGLAEVHAPSSVLPPVGGEVRDAALRTALTAHARLPVTLRRMIARFEAVSARDLRLHLDDGVVVRFGDAEETEAKARSVLLLLQQARAHADRRSRDSGGGGLGVAEIDVRAPDNPVLVPVAASPGGR